MPKLIRFPIRNAKILLWSKTKTGDPQSCWEFTGDLNEHGYGRISVQGRHMYAHRFSYMIHHDLTPEEMRSVMLRHTCDNPCCVNPTHLLPGTRTDNSDDKVSRNRHRKGSRVIGSKLTEEQVIEIRRIHATHDITEMELGKMYGVSNGTISDLLLGKTWKHVT